MINENLRTLSERNYANERERKSKIAQIQFTKTLAELNAELLESWHGAMKPHHIKCPNGHDCYTRPHEVILFSVIACPRCPVKWTSFYVVSNDSGDVKFGIASGNPKRRINRHRADGFKTIIGVYESLPDGWAIDIEDVCKLILKMADIKPIHGREYFSSIALKYVLEITDIYLSEFTKEPDSES